MLSDSIVSRFSFPDHFISRYAKDLTDSDVWHDVCTLFDVEQPIRSLVARDLLTSRLDSAGAVNRYARNHGAVGQAWAAYVNCLDAYVATDRVVLRPLADLDVCSRNDTEIADVVGADFRPVFDVPAWCEGLDTIGRAADTAQHGAGGMALPCCFYAEAARVMHKHGDEVVQYIGDDDDYALTLSPSSQDWSGFACHVLTIAVELWCGQFLDLDNKDLYVVARAGRVRTVKGGV